MRIGILLSRFPYPLEKGDKLRAYHQIRMLAKHHEIYLCALNVGKKITAKELKELEPYCQSIKIIRLPLFATLINLFKSLLFGKLPFQVSYFFHREKKKEVQQFFSQNNIGHLYCQLIRTTEYVFDYTQCPKTLDYMDALSQGMDRRIEKAAFYLKPFIKIEAKRLKRYEHFIFNAFDHKIIISEQDRELIVHANNKDIHIVRNGVDQTFFKPQAVEKEFELLFTGNMSYPPNVDSVVFLVNEVLPIVWESIPTAKLVIAGATPSSKVLSLKSNRVEVTGWVEDIRTYYAKTKLFVAPMQIGTGLQNKLLEAMSMALPCITTPLANNALRAEHQNNILIGERKEELAQYVIDLLQNDSERNRIAESAKSFIEQNYSWERSVQKMEKIIL